MADETVDVEDLYDLMLRREIDAELRRRHGVPLWEIARLSTEDLRRELRRLDQRAGYVPRVGDRTSVADPHRATIVFDRREA